MADIGAPANTPSVVERTRAVTAGAPVVAVHFLGRTAAFVLGEEAVVLVADKGGETPLALHGGGILSAATDGVSVVTGGDDGKVFVTDAKGESRLVATDAKRRWIDHVAAGPDGAVAWSAGKQAFAQAGKSETRIDRGAVDRRRACRSRRRDCGLPSPITTASRCGFRTRRPRPRCSSGRARTITSRSARTGNFW